MSRAMVIVVALVALFAAGCADDEEPGVVAFYGLTWQIEGVDTCGAAEHLGLPDTLLIDADGKSEDFIAFDYDCSPFTGGNSRAAIDGDDVVAPDSTSLLDCTRMRSGLATPMRFTFGDEHASFSTHVTIARSVGYDKCSTSYLLTGARQ